MTAQETAPTGIDEYIAAFPPEVRVILKELRATIREAAPEAEEAISYQLPTFRLKGNLVHFAAYPKHIGFYPTASGIERFQHELSGYQVSRGTIRFPLDRPIPYELVGSIVAFRVQENTERASARAKRGK